MTKDQRDAHIIIDRARKSIRREAKNGSRLPSYSQEQFLGICALLHASDYLRLGYTVTAGSFTAKFFGLETL